MLSRWFPPSGATPREWGRQWRSDSGSSSCAGLQSTTITRRGARLRVRREAFSAFVAGRLFSLGTTFVVLLIRIVGAYPIH